MAEQESRPQNGYQKRIEGFNKTREVNDSYFKELGEVTASIIRDRDSDALQALHRQITVHHPFNPNSDTEAQHRMYGHTLQMVCGDLRIQDFKDFQMGQSFLGSNAFEIKEWERDIFKSQLKKATDAVIDTGISQELSTISKIASEAIIYSDYALLQSSQDELQRVVYEAKPFKTRMKAKGVLDVVRHAHNSFEDMFDSIFKEEK